MAGDPEQLSAEVKNYVTQLVDQRKSDYTTRNNLIVGLRRQRYMRSRLRLPKSYQSLVGNNAPRAPLVYRLVQTAVGAIAKVPPEFRVIPRSPEYQKDADDAQIWAKLMLDALSRSSHRPIFWKTLDSMVGDGGAAVKILRTPWQDFPAKKDEEDATKYADRVNGFFKTRPKQPFVARVVDWSTFLPPTTEWGDGEIVEYGKRPTRSTLKSLRIVSGTGGLQRIADGAVYPDDQIPVLGPTMEVAEVWNDEACFIVIEGGEVFKFDNIYGKPPYIWSHGLTTSSYDPALEGVSVAFGLQYLQPWIDTLLSVISAWSILGGTPIMWTSQDALPNLPAGQEMAVKDIPFGKWVDFGVGGKGGYMEPPGVGAAITEAVNMMVQMADRVSISPVASGFIGTRTPGLALSAAMEAATANLTPIIDNAQNLFAGIVKFLFHCVENVVGGPVYVNGLMFEESESKKRRSRLGEATLKPSDVSKFQDVLCELEAQTLQDEIASGTHAVFMNRNGLWTRDRSMRYSGVKEPDKEEQGLIKDMVMQSPPVQQYLAMAAVANQPPLLAIMQQALMAGQEGGAEAEPGREEAPVEGEGMGMQNIGGPAPRGGGRPSGSPKQPGGSGRAGRGQPRGRMT